MLTQDQIQEIVRKQAQTKKNGATFLSIAGTLTVMGACYGFLDTQDTDWVFVLVYGFLVAMIGFTSYSKQ